MMFRVDIPDVELERERPEAGEMDLCDEIRELIEDHLEVEGVAVNGHKR